ncbi:MAG TPA: glycosyltransferase family 1 protein [Actinobacteria bacterium]|nr:glycosyltransferase family 1 protein [Actinomycetota bacterium]
MAGATVRIAIVCPYDLGRFGGVQDQTIRLRRWLREAGHDPVLVGPGEEGPPGAILLGKTTTVPANRAATPIGVDVRMLGVLQGHLGDCDVLHVHEPMMPVVGPAALQVEGPAKVATFHADPPRWARRAYRSMAPIARAILKPAHVVTAVSPVAASAIDKVVTEYRIVPNGIDLDAYTPEVGDPSRVVFLGRDDPRKGLSVLLKAWRRVARRRPGAELVVMGARRREGIDGVRFLGRVSEERKRAELAAAGVLVAPNTGGESFGLVVVEGMASACAVVASSIPAFVHVLGDTGIFVGPGDPIALAERLIGLLDNPTAIRVLGTAARERARRFDGSVVATAYLEAYEAALAANAP